MNRNHDMNELKKEYMDKEMSTQQVETLKSAIEKAKKEQEKKESRSRVMNMDLFLKEYASKAPAFTEGRIGEFMLELVEKGLLRESRIKGRPVMVIDKGVAHDKIGIQLMLECLKAFFEKFR